jgi:uncharacterized protein
LELQLKDLPSLVRGAAFFGAGGGGDPYVGQLMLEQALVAGASIRIIDKEALADGAFVVTVACMGAPTVMTEKIPNIISLEKTLRHMEKILNRQVDAIIPLEIGGINSTLPLILAAKTGLPVIDADGMGRAFPEIQMVTFGVYGCGISPVIVGNEGGDIVVVDAANNKQGEDLARSVVTQMGGQAQICCYPMTGAQIKATAVTGTLSLALEVGRAIEQAHGSGLDPFDHLFQHISELDPERAIRVLFDGKVVDIDRQTRGGFNFGSIQLQGIERFTGTLRVQFQNENIVAYRNDKMVAVVPDLIIVMDRETAEPLTSESIKYGQRVKVVGLSVPAMMTTPEALSVFGPKAFGLDHTYQSIAALEF